MVVYLAAEGNQTESHLLANGAQTHKAYLALAKFLQTLGKAQAFILPLPGQVGHGLRLVVVSQNGQYKQYGLLRHRRGVHAGIVAYIDTRLGRRLKVDLVVAYTKGLNDLQCLHPDDDFPFQRKHGIYENRLSLRVHKPLWGIVPIAKMCDFPALWNLAAIPLIIPLVY